MGFEQLKRLEAERRVQVSFRRRQIENKIDWQEVLVGTDTLVVI